MLWHPVRGMNMVAWNFTLPFPGGCRGLLFNSLWLLQFCKVRDSDEYLANMCNGSIPEGEWPLPASGYRCGEG